MELEIIMKGKHGQLFFVAAALVLVISAIYFVKNYDYQNQKISEVTDATKAGKSFYRVAEISVPAVDKDGKGVTTTLKVELIPGEGRILTNINQLLFWVDTQYSIQTAEMVAKNITKTDLSKIDLIYTIETDASLIEGPSAGAALAIATIAAIENKSISPKISITGTINPDGTIGQVGGIIEKARVSKEAGATLFLVPEGQGLLKNYSPVKKCEKIKSFTFCTIEYKELDINVISEYGIVIVEVATIRDALKYFSV